MNGDVCIKLLEASWDGDVKELMCMLETGVETFVTHFDNVQAL